MKSYNTLKSVQQGFALFFAGGWRELARVWFVLFFFNAV